MLPEMRKQKQKLKIWKKKHQNVINKNKINDFQYISSARSNGLLCD